MTSSKISNIATKIMLDDANEGFKNGNVVCSPFSLEILLGMLVAGAEGQTLKQLLQFLGCETTNQVLHESPSSKLCKILSSSNGAGADVSVANGAWVAKTVSPIQSRYAGILKTVYETEAGLLDFKDKSDEAVREINSWCAEKTKGLIPTIIESINRDTKIIFANALYFKGSWFRPFDYTMYKNFHLINGEKKTVSVPFMTTSSEIGYRSFEDGFSYGCFEGYKVLKIPYENERETSKLFSMYIFLPHKIDGLQDVLQTFHSNPDLFRERFDLQLEELGELWIPKFKISYKFEAQDVMREMGLTLPFDPKNNEFMRIIECRQPDEELLYVTQILQKSYVEIDEKGTKAAACSVAMMRVGGSCTRIPPSFVADHPFMFMIREDVSRAVFFVGVVLDPLEQSEHVQNQSVDCSTAEKYENSHRSLFSPTDQSNNPFRFGPPMAENYQSIHTQSPYSPFTYPQMAENYQNIRTRSPYSPTAHINNPFMYPQMAENFQNIRTWSPYSPMAENYQHFYNPSLYSPMAEKSQHFHNPSLAENYQHFHNPSLYSPMSEKTPYFHNRSLYTEEHQHNHKKPRKLTPTNKLTTVATKLLLDDANEGFKNGNLVCSPFSLEILLGMLAVGAVGETLEQLLEFLGHETLDQLLYFSPSLKLCKNLSSPNGGVDATSANGVWVEKSVSPFQQYFAEILEIVYDTKPGFLEFQNKPDEAAEEINSWINTKTKGLIPSIVKRSDLCDQDPRIVIIIANALYFKGSWFKPFDFTTNKDFHLINGGEKKTVSVPFMTTSSEIDYGSFEDGFGYGSFEYGFSYGSFEGYKVLKIPYANERETLKFFSMYIFLPHKIDGLQDLLRTFHSNPDLFRSRFDLKLQKLDELWIPKFKISYKFEAQDVMREMGLTLPFDPKNNEFLRIIECRQPDEDMLCVTKILQKCFIEIDEKGTKAAACSLGMMSFGGFSPGIPPSFVADHPFMFMIREDVSRAVFFVGVVLNPLE